MPRNIRHICRVMLGETGTDTEEDPGRERNTQKWQAKIKRGRGLHTERHTEKDNMRRHTLTKRKKTDRWCAHARTHTHTHTHK
jgi:hypothetical protein